MPDPFRCADAARERQDPMLGTAPPQRRFLLVEAPGGWAADGFGSLPLPQPLKDEVLGRAGAARVMLIRRPGRQQPEDGRARAWCVVDTRAPQGHRVTWGSWTDPTGLLTAVQAVERCQAWSTGAAASPTATGDDPRLLLVCTHGRKDVCCAVRGRPVAATLAGHWPQDTWECSHTGGDRFAANLLVLPDGAAYGGLDPDTAVTAVISHRDGRPDVDHLRGAVGWPRVVQAAVVGAYAQPGLRWGDVHPTGQVTAIEQLTDAQVAAAAPALAADGTVVGRWRVGLALPDGRRAVAEVDEHLRPARTLTCRAAEPAHSRVPVVRALRTMPG